MTQSNTDG